jgi:ABC-type uncharacterized transport system ATPase subunit
VDIAHSKRTVEEHLSFYARVKAIEDVKTEVNYKILEVGLSEKRHVQAHALSGGNCHVWHTWYAVANRPRQYVFVHVHQSTFVIPMDKTFESISQKSNHESHIKTSNSHLNTIH